MGESAELPEAQVEQLSPQASAPLDGCSGLGQDQNGSGNSSARASASDQCKRGRPRIEWGALLASPFFRRACQCSLGTAVILGGSSVPVVWTALSVEPIMANPAIILVLFYFTLLVSLSTGEAAARVAAQQFVGSLMGGILGLAVVYLVLAINGGSYQESLTKAVALVLLSVPVLFCATVCQFRFKQQGLAFQFLALVFSATTAASYHLDSGMHRLTLHWWAYSAIGGAVAYLCATFVLPITAGSVVRGRLAAGLQHSADTLRQALDLMSGDAAPDTGLLVAASGETAGRIGLDSGLYPRLEPLYASATAAGLAIQTAYSHLGFAPLQPEVYRRQRRFPSAPYRLLTTLARSLLNSVMMLVYPLQTGTMHALLVARHRRPLLALAGAVEECCRALGDTLVCNAPVSVAVEKLAAVEASYAELTAATRFKGSVLTQDTLALDMALSLLFTACTRLRRMVVLLPEALGRDQPSSLQPVVEHFAAELLEGEKEAQGQGRGQEQEQGHGSRPPGHVTWNFAALTQIPVQHSAESNNAIELLRASLLAAQPKRTASSQALQLLAAPELVQPPPAALPEGRLRRGLAWLQARTGVEPEHLALGCQLVAGYTPVLVMLILPAVNNAFHQNLAWALFVILSILQPSTGAAIFKGLQRLAGTVLAGVLGVCTQYTVFLINGLSYDNGLLKFAAMTVVLSLLAGVMAAASIKFSRYSYAFIIGCVLLAMTSLPGYQTGETMPGVALWRAVNTALGVAVEGLAVSLVFPVTAKQLFRKTMASTLDKLALVARQAFSSLLPPVPPPTSGQQQGQQEQHVAIRVTDGDSNGSSGSGGGGGGSLPLHSLRTKAPAPQDGSSQDAASNAVSSPLGSSVRRRHSCGASGSSGETAVGGGGGPATSASCSPASEDAPPAQRSRQLSQDLSITATVGKGMTFKIIGSVYARLLPDGFSASAGIVAMLQLDQAVHYELYPFSRTRRFPFDVGFRAQRLCRHMLNILSGAAIVLDSHEVEGLPMLAPFAPRLESLVEQLAACLEALAGLVRGHPPDRAVEAVLSLEEHVQRLLLLVLATEPPPGLAEADLISGLALLATLINASYVARLLALSLIRTFHPGQGSACGGDAPAAPAEAVLLEGGRATRWAADDRTLQLGLSILGVALGAGSSSAASGSGGGQVTPRWRTSSGGQGQGGSPGGPLGPAGGLPLAIL